MAPRRHHGHGHNAAGAALAAFGPLANYNNNNNNNNNLPPEVQGYLIDPEQIENHDANLSRCCVPNGECLHVLPNNTIDYTIHLDDLRHTVKVTCNNDQCTVGQYMHRDCFDAWEQTVLRYLQSCGRARSWSERQRHQNLWTKKGYDLAFKACGCLCGRGHLKKDLDWTPPPPGNLGRREDNPQDAIKKKKRRNRQNQRPTLAISATYHPHAVREKVTEPIGMNGGGGGGGGGGEARGRTGSLSSSNGSSSPPASASDPGVSPVHSGASGASSTGAVKKRSKFEFFSDRSRHSSISNGIFARRQDFSSFNALPKHKLNSYHIKMEDEGNHGNDDTRCFILSTLAAQHQPRVNCILCDASLQVYDRYPLIDGTFFVSPLQHTESCPEVKMEGRSMYLSAVCMDCLEAWGPGRALSCIHCTKHWDGASLVLGTMYAYDIFAASYCCVDRSRCTKCMKKLLHPHTRLNYFSDYSQPLRCPHCTHSTTHFVKPLPYCYTRDNYQAWP